MFGSEDVWCYMCDGEPRSSTRVYIVFVLYRLTYGASSVFGTIFHRAITTSAACVCV